MEQLSLQCQADMRACAAPAPHLLCPQRLVCLLPLPCSPSCSNGEAVALVQDTAKQPAMCAQVRGRLGWGGHARWVHGQGARDTCGLRRKAGVQQCFGGMHASEDWRLLRRATPHPHLRMLPHLPLVQRLVTEALGRGGTDNVACLVAFLGSDGATGGWGWGSALCVCLELQALKKQLRARQAVAARRDPASLPPLSSLRSRARVPPRATQVCQRRRRAPRGGGGVC